MPSEARAAPHTGGPALTRPDAITRSRAAGCFRVPGPDGRPSAPGSRGARVGARHPRGRAAAAQGPAPPPRHRRAAGPAGGNRRPLPSGSGASPGPAAAGGGRAARGQPYRVASMVLAAPPTAGAGGCQGVRRSPSACGATPAPGTRSSSTIDSRRAWHRKRAVRRPAAATLCARPTQGRSPPAPFALPAPGRHHSAPAARPASGRAFRVGAGRRPLRPSLPGAVRRGAAAVGRRLGPPRPLGARPSPLGSAWDFIKESHRDAVGFVLFFFLNTPF